MLLMVMAIVMVMVIAMVIVMVLVMVMVMVIITITITITITINIMTLNPRPTKKTYTPNRSENHFRFHLQIPVGYRVSQRSNAPPFCRIKDCSWWHYDCKVWWDLVVVAMLKIMHKLPYWQTLKCCQIYAIWYLLYVTFHMQTAASQTLPIIYHQPHAAMWIAATVQQFSGSNIQKHSWRLIHKWYSEYLLDWVYTWQHRASKVGSAPWMNIENVCGSRYARIL